MRLSVVVPALNEERALAATLARTLALGFDEVFVVDGGSRDRTREVATQFVERRTSNVPPVIVLSAPTGRASQMNAGAAAASGDALLFLHADTTLPDGARAAIERALADPACVGGRFDVRFDRDRGTAWLVSRMMNLRSRWTGIATGDQALFVRRAVFDRLGGFSDVPIMEDVDFSRRLKRAGRLAALRLKVVTSFRRWEVCGPFRTILLMWLLRFLYWIGVSPHTLKHMYSDER